MDQRIWKIRAGYVVQCGFDSINSNFNTAHQFILSNNGDLDIAASELYRSFHVMDARKFERLYIEWLLEKGIGRAINDRIKRAIQKTQRAQVPLRRMESKD